MGGLVTGVNSTHFAACLAAEIVRQAAVAGGNLTQSQMDAIERTYHRSIIASCKANNGGNGIEASLIALQSLGVNS